MHLFNKNKKGISPILASILMVAFTVAIAGFVSSWMSQTTKTATENAGNASDSVSNCLYASIEANDVYFNSSSTEKLKFDIRNTGTKTLTVDKIRVNAKNSSTVMFTEKYTLYAGDELPVSLQITSDILNISSVRIIPKECPNVAVTIEETEIN